VRPRFLTNRVNDLGDLQHDATRIIKLIKSYGSGIVTPASGAAERLVQLVSSSSAKLYCSAATAKNSKKTADASLFFSLEQPPRIEDFCGEGDPVRCKFRGKTAKTARCLGLPAIGETRN